MSYIDPTKVLSPKGSIKNLTVIRDGGENGWSLAEMEWDGSPVLAMRWNGGSNNGFPSIGNPQSRGIPTWFVLPEEVGDAMKAFISIPSVAKPPLVGAASASSPAS
jgi:hypothetical protein